MRKIIAFVLVIIFVCLNLSALSIATMESNPDSKINLEDSEKTEFNHVQDDDAEEVSVKQENVHKAPVNVFSSKFIRPKRTENSKLNGISLEQNHQTLLRNLEVPKTQLAIIEENIKNSNLGYLFNNDPKQLSSAGLNLGNIQVNNDYGLDIQYQPSIAVGPSGNIYIVWLDNRWVNRTHVYFARSQDNGQTFDKFSIINDEDPYGIAGVPDLAVDKNEIIYVVWHDDRFGDNDIWLIRSDDKGDSWTNDIDVNKNNLIYNQTNPVIALNNDQDPPTVWIAWQDPTKSADSHDGVYASYSANMGNDFLSEIDIYTNSQKRNVTDIDIAVDELGVVWIVWSENRTSDMDKDIYYTRSTSSYNIGISNPLFGFNTRVDDAQTGTNQTQPVFGLFNHTTVYLAWEDDRSNHSRDIYFAPLNSSSLNFSSSYQVNSDPGELADQYGPSIAVNQSTGTIFLSWFDGRNGYYELYTAKSTNKGMSFDDEVLINDALRNLKADETMYTPAQNNLAVDTNGDLYVVYCQNRYGTPDIFYQSSKDSGSTWTGSIMVNENSTESMQSGLYQYQIAIDSQEIIHIVWEDMRAKNESIGTDIYYAQSDDNGLTFTTGKVVNYKTDGIQKNPCIAVNDSFIYVAWVDAPSIDQGGDIYFSHSEDGGVTWWYNATAPTPDNLQVNSADSLKNDHPAIALNSSGSVFITYEGENQVPDPPSPMSFDIYVGYSDFNNNSWEFNQFSQVLANNDSVMYENHQYNPSIAIDHSNNNIYVVFEDQRNLSKTGPDINIAVANSSAILFEDNYLVNDKTNDIHESTTVHKNPSIAVNATGNISVVWHDDREGYNNVYYARSADYGKNWTANLRINTNTTNDKQMASIYITQNQNIYVAWHDERNGTKNIYMAKSTTSGNSFATEVRVDDDASSIYDQTNPAIAANSSNGVFVVFTDERSYTTDIINKVDFYIARSTNDGATFEKNYCMHTYQGDPVLAIDTDGTVYVAWTDFRFGKWDIFFAKSINSGQYFNVNVPLNENRDNIRGNPDIAVNNSNIYVVWEDAVISENNKTILLTTSTDGGESFSANIDISNQEGNQVNPAVALDSSGVLHAVWQDNFAPTIEKVYYANSSDWSGRRSIFNPILNHNLWNPCIALDDGQTPYRIFVVFENRTDSSDWNISYSVSTDGGRSFKDSTLLNDDSGGAKQSNPAIDSDSKNNVAVVWQDFRNGNWDIFGTLSSNSGDNFGLNVAINVSSFNERNPDVVIDRTNSSRVMVVFQSNNDTSPDFNYNIYAAISNDGGSTYYVTHRIDDTGSGIQDQIKPRVTSDGMGSIGGVWEDFRGGNGDIYFYLDDETLPYAEAGPDQYIDQNEEAHFLANNSWDNVGIANYTWSFTDVSGKTVYGYNTQYLFTQPGDYQVTLTVTDHYGNQAVDSLWVYVRDRSPPVFVSDNTPTVAYTGDSFQFSTQVTDYQLHHVNVTYWYGFTNTTKFSTTLSGTGPYTHTITIENQSVHLYYQFSANDTTNNWRFESIKSVPVYDNDAPVIDTANEVTPNVGTTGDQFVFSINCTDNIKVEAGYVWYKYGAAGTVNKIPLVQTAHVFTHTINNLPNSLTPLYYNFSFVDNSSIPGGPNWVSSTEKQVTIIDNDKPGFGTDDSDATAVANNTFSFSMTFTDNVETASATVYYWYGTDTTESSMALTDDGDSWDAVITIPNSLDALNYYFNFSDTSGNWDTNIENQIDVSDDEDPIAVTGSGNIQTNTGESFEIYAKFTDNIELAKVTVFYAKETTSAWLDEEVTITGNRYLATNEFLNINTTNDVVGWKYYFEAEDSSENSVTYGTPGDPFTITVTDNIKPTADAGDDKSVKVDTTVTFDASGSSDNIGITKYSWKFEYNEEPKVLNGETQSFKFEDAGTYEVTLEVQDAAELKDTDVMTVTVTADIAPPITVLDNPTDGATISDNFITLSWHTTHPNYDFVTYDLYFGTDPDPTLYKEDIEHEDPVNKIVEIQIDDLEDETTYYWAVKGQLGSTPGPKSEIRSFSVDLGKVVYDVEITSDKDSVEVEIGTDVSVTLTVKNTGTTIDLFDLTIDKGTFPGDVELEFTEVQVDKQLTKDVKLTFSTSETVTEGTFMVKITATSRSSTDVVVSDIVEISVTTVKEVGEDSDGDNLPDTWEIKYWGDITTHDGDDDPDEDGKTNKEEYDAGTDPTKKVEPGDDTDEDGLPDSWENEHFGSLKYGPNDDPDDDGETNIEEYNAGTDPNKKEGDGGEDGDMTMIIVAVVVIIIVVVLVLFMMMKGKGGKKEPETEEPEQAPVRAPGTIQSTKPGPGTGPTPGPKPSPTPTPTPGTPPQPGAGTPPTQTQPGTPQTRSPSPSIQQLKGQQTPQTQQVPGQKPPTTGGQ